MKCRQGGLLTPNHQCTWLMLAFLFLLLPKFAMAQFAYPPMAIADVSIPVAMHHTASAVDASFPVLMHNPAPALRENPSTHPLSFATSAYPSLLYSSHLTGDTQVENSHSPKKATILAIVLPGSGQIYNQKYWKVPLVYVGLGASVWAIGHFRGEMRVLNDSISGIFGAGKTPSAQLIADRDLQRSRRDVAILCLAGVYILQVIDATVDAHFFKFNINENIGLRVSPIPSRTLALQYKF